MSATSNRGIIMKLKDNLTSFTFGGEQMLVIPDDGESAGYGIVRSNRSAAVIVECLKQETDREAILERLRSLYEGDESEMREDIDAVLKVLRQAGVLEE